MDYYYTKYKYGKKIVFSGHFLFTNKCNIYLTRSTPAKKQNKGAKGGQGGE